MSKAPKKPKARRRVRRKVNNTTPHLTGGVLQHAVHCPTCRRIFTRMVEAALEQLRSELSSLPALNPPPRWLKK
jgi:hypothetical protein